MSRRKVSNADVNRRRDEILDDIDDEISAAIYFTTAGDMRPCELSTHAIDRFIERYGHAFRSPVVLMRELDLKRWEIATRLLGVAMANAQIETWKPADLDGLGQGVWLGHVEGLAVRLSVDGNGLVRTVLP